MALVRVRTSRITEIFIAEEPIGALTSVCLGTAGKSIKGGSSATQEFVAGISIAGGALSAAIRVVTHGIVSGVICGTLVSAGDRLTSYTSGKVTPINTITPAGAISGLITAVAASVAVSGYISHVSGWLNLFSGAITSGFIGVDANTRLALSGAQLSGLGGFEIITQPLFQSGGGVVTIGTQPEFQSGAFVGTAFNTARVLAKALDHGGVGSGIRVHVDIGG